MMEQVDLKQVLKEIDRVGLRRWLLLMLTDAFEVARKGKLRSMDEHSFDLHWMENIVSLRDAVLERRYEPGRSVAFVIFDPMVREIFAAPFKDRVIHHFLYKMCAGWWDHRFINDSFSCRVGKGTLYGIQRLQKMMRQVSEGGQREAWAMKMDIRGYFMSLPRERLYERVRWGLTQQFAEVMDEPMGEQLFAICAYLWEKVIMDDPVKKAWRRGSWRNWDPEVLPARKSLYCQPAGYGMPIGNVTSQLASNIYMDVFDRFVKFELGYEFFMRYVDDFIILVTAEEKKRVLGDVGKMEAFLREELELTLHPDKRYFQPVEKGVNFLGARVHLRCIYPSDRLQAKFPQALYDLVTGEGELESVISYLGLMTHMNAEKYIQGVMERAGQG